MSDEFFLEPGENSDTPFPVRQGCKVTPLIESAEMYPALERELLTAKKYVWLAFRVLDPATKVRSQEAISAGHETWLDVIGAAIERGVDVRILLTDFEPVLADYLHAGSWSSYRALYERLGGNPSFQMIVIQHEGEIGWSWRQFLRLVLRKRVRNLVTKLLGERKGDDTSIFDIRPGIWRWVNWNGEEPRAFKPGPPPRLWPATYHQKCAVIDGVKAIIGGLDLDERRWDDADHGQRADQTWHDVSSLVEGKIAEDAAHHFVDLWNCELPRFEEILSEWTTNTGRSLAKTDLTELTVPNTEHPKTAGTAKTQLLRTRSRKSASIFATGPLPDIRELKEGHRRIILSAHRILYIEAQFFRSKAASKWVIKALERQPTLEVIILIANAPEEVAFLRQGDHPVHRHGEHLQARALGSILKAHGPGRAGLFTLAKEEAADRGDRQFRDSRGTAYGSGLIHIHAKLLIADDEACLMSSANINGRSFEWDTELGYLWREENGAIRHFRRELWNQLFAGNLPENATLADWHSLAEHNRTADPSDREGFVVPYQRSRARRFGNPYWWIPDSIV